MRRRRPGPAELSLSCCSYRPSARLSPGAQLASLQARGPELKLSLSLLSPSCYRGHPARLAVTLHTYALCASSRCRSYTPTGTHLYTPGLEQLHPPPGLPCAPRNRNMLARHLDVRVHGAPSHSASRVASSRVQTSKPPAIASSPATADEACARLARWLRHGRRCGAATQRRSRRSCSHGAALARSKSRRTLQPLPRTSQRCRPSSSLACLTRGSVDGLAMELAGTPALGPREMRAWGGGQEHASRQRAARMRSRPSGATPRAALGVRLAACRAAKKCGVAWPVPLGRTRPARCRGELPHQGSRRRLPL
ncbi:hypothetical protein FA09DRAFT_74800 [Tilletiopsis washingtonensis]|jgi:hypothetical protein|uniref:Uncharacterized protein n=1 Tax=Tilletiopsis washingtonensis TaxID=58919 RepID=A0A316Z6Q3_9BASI|nr:hypothetical protein FA09DRAFT_74800 [Tilletiopsis washingtonensis]PWN96976.1 hypothetical protein FA09DRAFT_74800 [Tilletiopsis washingtonensis]